MKTKRLFVNLKTNRQHYCKVGKTIFPDLTEALTGTDNNTTGVDFCQSTEPKIFNATDYGYDKPSRWNP